MIKNQSQTGALLILVLIFGAVFFVVVSSYLGYIITQHRIQESKYQSEQALNIAESGIDYYKWYLAHNPDDTTHGTGAPGPYVVPYVDPESGPIGEFSLEVSSSTYCGEVSSIDLVSTGYTYDDPDNARSIYAKYARPTVAEYAYIIDDNVWAGEDRVIVGPYFSNKYIRMDGTNNSTVSSGQGSWTCDGTLGCSPYGSTLNSVFGSGPNSALWNFSVPPINFTGLTVDLAVMKDRAQNGGGIYIPYSGSRDYGYRVDFQDDGTVDVYEVDRVTRHYGYTTEDDTQYEYNIIADDDFYATYTINDSCPLIFVEDKVWLEGEVDQKVTIAAADTDTPGRDHSIILEGNITYSSSSAGLLAVAEEDVLVGVAVPDDMELNGIFVAQKGRFGRNLYYQSYLPWSYRSFYKRNSLTINGTIVSKRRVGTKWVDSWDSYISGFNYRYNSYDRDLVDSPPPLAPKTSDDYKFVEWRDEG